MAVSIPGEKNTQAVLASLGNTAQLYFRPGLCYAPAFTVAKGKSASTGPLPTCSASTALTAANLGVKVDPSNANGYTSNTALQDDPQFAPFPSTSPDGDTKGGHRPAALPEPGQPGHRPHGPRPLHGDRHGGQVRHRPAPEQPVGGEHRPHRARGDGVGRPRPAAVPRHHRHRSRRQDHLGADHPAHQQFLPVLQRPGPDFGRLHRGPGEGAGHRAQLRCAAGQARPDQPGDGLPDAGQGVAAGGPDLRPGRPGPGDALRALLLPPARRGGHLRAWR